MLEGYPYYFTVYGVTLTLTLFLIADTVFVSVNEAMDEKNTTMMVLF